MGRILCLAGTATVRAQEKALRRPLKEGWDCHQQRRDSMAQSSRPEDPSAKASRGPAGCARRLVWESRGAGSRHGRRPEGRVHGADPGPLRAAPRQQGARSAAVPGPWRPLAGPVS